MTARITSGHAIVASAKTSAKRPPSAGVELLVGHVWPVFEVLQPGTLYEPVGHERTGGDHGLYPAAIDHLAEQEPLLRDRHRAGYGDDTEALLIRTMASSTSAASPWRRPPNAVMAMARTRSSTLSIRPGSRGSRPSSWPRPYADSSRGFGMRGG